VDFAKGFDFGGSPPYPSWPTQSVSQSVTVAGGAPQVALRPTAHVTPSRLATRTALSYSLRARDCHLDVTTLRRFTPAAAGRGRGGRG
jgi:hypothetical protein